MLSKHKAWLKLAEMFEPGERLPTIYPETSWAPNRQRVDGVCIGTIYLRVRGFINVARELEMDGDLRRLFKPLRGSRHLGYFWRKKTHRKERAAMCGFMAAMAGRKHE